MGVGRSATPATGAFGVAPDGATKRVRGLPKWVEQGMRTLLLGPPVELPIGAVSGAQISHDEDDQKMRGTVARIMRIEEGAKD